MELDIGVDLQLQIFILAAVFGFVLFIIICFLAGVCGKITKIKRIQRKLIENSQNQSTGYENYAFSSRNIQPDEELSRRGYTMYDPYRNNNNNQTSNVQQNSSHHNHSSSSTLNRLSKTQYIKQSNVVELCAADGENRDEAAEYAIANAETVVMTGNDVEMKIQSSSLSYPPEFRGIPPPPAFVNRFDIEQSESITKSDEQKP